MHAMIAMPLTRIAVCALAGLAVWPSIAVSQQISLVELARREEARRKAIKTPAKVLTNEDLKGGTGLTVAAPEAPKTAAPAAPAAAQPAATPAPAPEKPAEDPKRDRQYWQDRLNTARTEIDRSKVYLDALQSRINALSTDFVNRDDPAQRAVIEQDRKRAVAELERLKTQIQQMVKGLADIEEEARRLGVPPGWLR